MTIRPATLDDMPRLLELGENMLQESPRFRRLRFDAGRLRETLAMLIESERGFLWVGETASGVMGCMAAMVAPHWASSDFLATDLALFVYPAARGSLIPVRLVNRYVQWARDCGATIIQVGITTGVQTESTTVLYERMGLRRCGIVMET